MNDDQMEDLAREVAFLRGIVAEISAMEAGVKAVLEASQLYEHYLAARESRIFYDGILATVENAFREAAVEYYQVTGSKQMPGGGVRVSSVPKYVERDAIDWAADHYRTALRLNKREFEKVTSKMVLPFLVREEVPSGTIKGDLSEFLEEELSDLDA